MYQSQQYNPTASGVYNPMAQHHQQPPAYGQQQQQQQPPHQQPANPNTFNTDLTRNVIHTLNIKYTPGAGDAPVDPETYGSKIKLYQSRQDSAPYENRADLYGILVSLEHLEGAFLRDAISPSEYTGRCSKLLSQYKTWMDIHKSLINNDIQSFIQQSHLTCPAAMNRIQAGQPATIVHGGHEKTSGNSALAVADISDSFLTAIDSVAFTKEKDALLPLLNQLLESLLRYQPLPSNHECTQLVSTWATKMAAFPSAYYLTEAEVKQLSGDLENARSALRRFLAQSNK